jgi:hypothetical protein
LRFLALLSDEAQFEELRDTGVQALISALKDKWDHFAFEDIQAVFLDWMERLSGVINSNGEYYIK